MKKFTLLSVLMLFAFVAFAQRNVHPIQTKALPVKANVLKNINGIDRKAPNNMRKAPRKAEALVTAPNEGEVWAISEGAFFVYTSQGFEDYTQSDYISKTMNVCIDGSDIYIQGLASAFFPEGWVKGTISGNKVTIPCGQCVGEDEYGPEYIVGFSASAETGDEPGVDIVFDYDATAGTLSLNESVGAIVESADPESVMAYALWEGLQLTKTELITSPSEGEEYIVDDENTILAYWDDSLNDGKGGWYDATQEIEETFSVVIDGTDIYIRGLDTFYLPDAWVKGTISDNKAVFPTGQYAGTDDDGYSDFIVGVNYETGEIVDINFTYDPETGKLTLDENIVLAIFDGLNYDYCTPYYYWQSLTLIKAASDETPDAISTINAKQENGAIYNLQGVKMNKPTQKGVYIHNGRKVIVK